LILYPAPGLRKRLGFFVIIHHHGEGTGIMPLYHVSGRQVSQIRQTTYLKERDLQRLFEENLDALFGVRFVASEFTTGDRQRGRIDSLGLDQDNYPTIIEYKKSNKENIINQGLFYMDWLVDHKGDFALAVQKALGSEVRIDWSRPRLILVAESFSEYDKYAVNRIGANVELWTYRKYGEDLLYLDSLFVASPQPVKGTSILTTKEPETERHVEEEAVPPIYTLEDHKARKPKEIIELFEALRDKIFALAEEGEIIEKANKMYIGYKHGKNFCEVRLQAKVLQIWLDISPLELDDPDHLARDVTKIGHYGTGNVEIRLSDITVIERVMRLIEQAFLQTI
jgi:predicted transport protein